MIELLKFLNQFRTSHAKTCSVAGLVGLTAYYLASGDYHSAFAAALAALGLGHVDKTPDHLLK